MRDFGDGPDSPAGIAQHCRNALGIQGKWSNRTGMADLYGMNRMDYQTFIQVRESPLLTNPLNAVVVLLLAPKSPAVVILPW
jgi:hypothetical protein